MLLAGCAAGEPTPPRTPDRAQFDAVIYPILMRDCGFSTCHGAEGRFFHVFGPGRTRLDAMLDNYEAPTEAELTLAYQRTVAMLDPDGRPEATLLLTKPLDPEAGGAGHGGVDRWGRDVYLTTQDPSYQQLRAWALGQAVAAPNPAPGGAP